ncbi:transposase [Nocardia nova]|uniref:transposase n=1 Tax=Nocardia nova TaxID=37330 RepID=UPI0011B04A20|nr:transposase [Nocardia nova]
MAYTFSEPHRYLGHHHTGRSRVEQYRRVAGAGIATVGATEYQHAIDDVQAGGDSLQAIDNELASLATDFGLNGEYVVTGVRLCRRHTQMCRPGGHPRRPGLARRPRAHGLVRRRLPELLPYRVDPRHRLLEGIVLWMPVLSTAIAHAIEGWPRRPLDAVDLDIAETGSFHFAAQFVGGVPVGPHESDMAVVIAGGNNGAYRGAERVIERAAGAGFQHAYATKTELVASVDKWMNFYNTTRRHSAIGNQSPDDYERSLRTAAA